MPTTFGPPSPLSGPNPPKSARMRAYQPLAEGGESGLPEPFVRLFFFLRIVPPEREVARVAGIRHPVRSWPALLARILARAAPRTAKAP
jgi:hypothetical protein